MYATSLVSNYRDEISRFLTGINGDLEEVCRSAMLHDNIDLSKLMVYVQHVQDNWKKRGIRDARRPQPLDQPSPSYGGHRNNFGIHEQPKFKKGQQSSGNSNSRRSTILRGGRFEPKKVNVGEMQHPNKNCVKYGRAHNG